MILHPHYTSLHRRYMPTVYTKHNCHGCAATTRYLNENGIAFIEKNVDTDERAREKVMALGFKQMPVVVTDTDSWFGFDPGKLAQI